MRDYRDYPMFTDAMLRRGSKEPRIRKFLAGNFLRVFGQVTGR
ncbi:MAG: membrane dipeptidase [Acidobacteria bacterium]|nr:membrane dipeptidase [Acidobacteriota bacterium]